MHADNNYKLACTAIGFAVAFYIIGIYIDCVCADGVLTLAVKV